MRAYEITKQTCNRIYKLGLLSLKITYTLYIQKLCIVFIMLHYVPVLATVSPTNIVIKTMILWSRKLNKILLEIIKIYRIEST